MKITVLLGGSSSERDVSIASGTRIVEALRSRGHEVTAVDPATGVLDRDAEQRLADEGVEREPPTLEELKQWRAASMSPALATMPEVRGAEVVFLALHGGQGEDGTVQALLDMIGVRYTGSGHLASALAMDKDLTKIVLRAAGVQTPDWIMAPATSSEVRERIGIPAIVKPSKQGSTVGLTVVKDLAHLDLAVAEAFQYDDEVMIEAFIAGRELTVGILGGEALPVIEIFPKHEIYDYECKYTAGMAEERPAELSAETTARIQQQARLAFRALKLEGCARIDFRMNADEQLQCLEANTLPGMTELSLIPQAAAAAGMEFAELCERIVQLALEERSRATQEAATGSTRVAGDASA